MNPFLVGRAFVVVIDPPSPQTDTGDEAQAQHHTDLDSPPLGVSAEALRQGVRQNMPVRQIAAHFPAVTRVPAAAWRSPSSTPVLQAYHNLAERGPVQLLRRVVTGDGLELVEDNKRGQLGEYSVQMQGASGDEESVSISVLLERAKELGTFLQAELGRLLGYRLVLGVGRTVEEARGNAKGLLLFRLKKPPGTSDASKKDENDNEHTDNHDAEEGTEMPSPPEAKGHTKARWSKGGIDVEDKEEDELEVAEFICSTCKACFFEAVELVAHVQKEHEEDSSFSTKTIAARAPAQDPPFLSVKTAAAVNESSSKTKKRPRDMRAASCSPSAPTPTPPLRPQGPGTVTMSEVFATLTEAADITAFLREIGAPPVHLPGWPPPPGSQKEQT